jgi:O-antigen/teichoic acid export membrane protein
LKVAFSIFANTLVQGVGKVISAATTFFVIILIGRAFGEGGYGEFAKIFALVELFYMVSDFGFNAIVVRQAARRENDTKKLFGNLLGLRFAWSLFWAFFVSFIAFLLPYNPLGGQGFSTMVKLGVLVASLNILSQGFLTSANSIFQLKLRYDQSVLALFLGSVVKLLLVFLFVQIGLPILMIVFALVLSEAIVALSALFLVARLIGPWRILFDLLTWKKIFSLSFPIGLALVFNLIYFRSDILILSFFRSSAEVGNYSLAYRFFESSLVVPIFFANALYPVLIKSHALSLDKFKRTIIFSFLTMIFCSILVFILLFVAVPPVIGFFFHGGFQDSIFALRILILGLPFFYTSAIFMWTIVILDRQKALSFIFGGAAFLNIILNLIFIPHFGYRAAALITVISEGLVLALMFALSLLWLFARKDLKKSSPIR